MATPTPSLCRLSFTSFQHSLSPSLTPIIFKTTVHPSLPICLTTRKLSWSTTMNQLNSTESPATAKTESTTSENRDNVLLQYVVLRRDLIDMWPLGSVVTQGCHASVGVIWSHKDDAYTLQYCSPENINSMHKVTLEVKGETQILSLSEKLTAGGIAHKLWIEQPENIPTCLATKPYPKSMVSLYFKKLKLCK